MIPAVRSWTRDEMMQRFAFFKDLKGSKTGLPDSDLPECDRELINVIGFHPPDNEGDVVSPVGSTAARLSAIPISEGFNLGFARCKPGRGLLMHNHDTNETFMPITGRWRCARNEGAEYEFVDVGQCDVVSFPPGVARRFMNVTEGEPDTEHLLLFVVAGNGPQAEFTHAEVTACLRRPGRNPCNRPCRGNYPAFTRSALAMLIGCPRRQSRCATPAEDRAC